MYFFGNIPTATAVLYVTSSCYTAETGICGPHLPNSEALPKPWNQTNHFD